jgi:hypothetical protein
MSHLLKTTETTIGGKSYTIRLLSVEQARRILPIVQRAVGSLDPDVDVHGRTLIAGFTGLLSPEDMDKLVNVFAPTTTVDMADRAKAPDGTTLPARVLRLDQKTAQDELWGGELELMLEWVDACIDANFGSMIAKTRGVVKALTEAQARATPKAQPTE